MGVVRVALVGRCGRVGRWWLPIGVVLSIMEGDAQRPDRFSIW